MKHFYDIDVLTTDVAATPKENVYHISKGLISWCGIFFPPGCHGVVHAKVLFQEHQILPRNPDGWCHGNDGWWDGKLYFPVTAQPFEIKVIAYSDNALFDHTITIGLELTPFSMIPAWDKLIGVLTKIARLFGVHIPKEQPSEMKP